MPDEVIAEQKPSLVHTINKAVKESLTGVGAEVQKAITANLVKEETERRIKAATQVFQKIESLEKDLRKMKPKFLGYDINGKGVGEPIYTKDEAESVKKSNESLAKLNGALAKALEEGDFTKVFELAGGQ